MKSIKIFSMLIVIIFLSSSAIFAQAQKHKGMGKGEMKKENPKVENIVRDKEPIDLASIDKNKDGKVFQDPMDWNVISDAPGKCPLCKMTLKEVTLQQAKENLIKHDYKVK